MMGRLQTLKPRVQQLALHVLPAAGDQRIRGSSLQVIRERILSRDCGVCRCARCALDGVTRAASIVDHRIPLWAGGRETDENRQAISVECHDLKTAHEAACRARGLFEPWQGGGESL